MYNARPTALRFTSSFAVLLLMAACSGLAAAQSAATSSDQWRAVGGAQSADSQAVATPGTDPTWQVPDGQSDSGGSQAASDASNPLRKDRNPQVNSAAREPRAFQAPANATPLRATQSAGTNYTKPSVPPRSNSASPAMKTAQAANPTYVLPRQVPNRGQGFMQRPGAQAARPTTSNQVKATSPADDLWQTINVAFQGQPTPKKDKDAPENLPMPGDGDGNNQDPVMRYPSGPDAFRNPSGMPYYRPYGQQDPFDESCCPNGCGNCCNSCGNGVCEPGCGCPCGACCNEPGCGCEPGCGAGCGAPCGDQGCPCEPGRNCDKCCERDLLCLGPGDDEACQTVRFRWPKWQEVTVFGGVQGFKGPYDQDRDSGNFGFHEGFNVGAKVPYALAGYQFGWRGAQSQLNGDKDTDIENQHFQQFVTAGFFHRSNEGLQIGTVWDMLNDERFKAHRFHQIRSEASIRSGCREIGVTATIGLNDHKFDDGNGDEITFQASDQFLLFFRLHGPNGGEGRIYAGANNDSDGIVGSDMTIPIGDRFSVQSGFTYLIPDAKSGEAGASQEAWNIGLGLVWHFDAQARKSFENCYRPMFNVADNGLLIVDQRKKN